MPPACQPPLGTQAALSLDTMNAPTISSLDSFKVISVRAHGPRFDLASIRALMAQAQEALHLGATTLIVDLSELTAIDSVGVSSLVSIRRRADSAVRIVLAGLQPAVQTVARVCHLHEMFDIYTSADAAKRALSS
jgi:anti-sigma B factor antagonist